MRDAAKALGARNFRVFPVAPNGKTPRVKRFYETATTDPAEIDLLWPEGSDSNIGIDCSSMIVIDIDNKSGVDGMASYLALDLPLDTLLARTPTGGYHAFFSGSPRALSVGRLGPGLDVRSFHGYVLGVGSVIDGRAYTWDNDAPILPAPQHLLDRLDAPRERSASLLDATTLDTEFAIARAAKYLADEAQAAIEGAGGDMTTFKTLCIAKDMGLSADCLLDLAEEHYNPRCLPPWDHDELRQKVENAFAYALSGAGGQSPAVDFLGVSEVIPPRYVQPAPTNRRWQHHGDPLDLDATWLFYEMLPQTGVAVLSGPSQGGKTFVLMHLARALATGKAFFGIEPDDRGGTILLTGEGRRSVRARMQALEEPDALPIVSGDINNLAASGALDALEADLREKIAELHARFGVPVRMVAIDTLSASGLLKDENDNSEAGVALKALSVLSEKLGVLVVVTHHPPKSGTGQRGAGALYNDVDVVVEIIREATNSIRELKVTKARDAQQRSLGVFTLVPTKLGNDSRGRAVTSCYVSDAPPTERDLTKSPKHVELLLQSVEFTLVDDGENIEGQRVADVEVVKGRFKEDYTGSKDPSNFRKTWDATLGFAIESGAVKILPLAGRKYLSLPSFSASPQTDP